MLQHRVFWSSQSVKAPAMRRIVRSAVFGAPYMRLAVVQCRAVGVHSGALSGT